MEFDLVTLLAEDILGSLVDVLKEENLDVLGIEGLQLLRRLVLGVVARSKRVW